jgi:hypothetical protein
MVGHWSDAEVADNTVDVANAEVADNAPSRVGQHDDAVDANGAVYANGAVDANDYADDPDDADHADDAANVITVGAPQRRSDASVEDRFGFAILRLRLYRRWSQRDLQHRSGVHQSQISRLESGFQRGCRPGVCSRSCEPCGSGRSGSVHPNRSCPHGPRPDAVG